MMSERLAIEMMEVRVKEGRCDRKERRREMREGNED